MPDETPGKYVRETPLQMKVEHRGEAVVLHLSGSCTMNVAAQLGDQLISLASRPQPTIIVEMSGLDFIESTGLGGIVAGYLRSRRYRGEYRLSGPQPPIRHLLEITRLTQLFPVYESLEEALAARPTQA